MAYKVLKSNNVAVFPISNVRRYSDDSVDNRARAISEYNLTNLISSVGRNDFVRSVELKDENYHIRFVIHGYDFYIKLSVNEIYEQDTYAMIKLYTPNDNPLSYSIGKDVKNNSINDYEFTGLYITNTNDETIILENDSIDISNNYEVYYLKLLSYEKNSVGYNAKYGNEKYLYHYFEDNFKLMSSTNAEYVHIVPIESIRDYEFYEAQSKQDSKLENHSSRIDRIETVIDGGYEE